MADAKFHGAMASNLPLLFAKGRIKSLIDLSLEELLHFIPFLLKCCSYSKSEKPVWWFEGFPYPNLFHFVHHKNTEEREFIRSRLIQSIELCYTQQRCQYLLKFCHEVSNREPDDFYFRDNNDGSTTMLETATQKVLVTFRNENKDYDNNFDCMKWDTLKKFDEKNGTLTTSYYTCKLCFEKFASEKQFQIHKCAFFKQNCIELIEDDDDEFECIDQIDFLAFHDLKPVCSRILFKKKKCSAEIKVQPNIDSIRYFSIPFSSPLGCRIVNNTYSAKNFTLNCLFNYERFIQKSYSTFNSTLNHWPLAFRPTRSQISRKLTSLWFHKYSFNNKERVERLRVIQTGLTKRSRILLHYCKPVAVEIKRLPPDILKNKLNNEYSNISSFILFDKVNCAPVQDNQNNDNCLKISAVYSLCCCPRHPSVCLPNNVDSSQSICRPIAVVKPEQKMDYFLKYSVENAKENDCPNAFIEKKNVPKEVRTLQIDECKELRNLGLEVLKHVEGYHVTRSGKYLPIE